MKPNKKIRVSLSNNSEIFKKFSLYCINFYKISNFLKIIAFYFI